MSEFKYGLTAPPFHVRCKTTTAPYFKDMDDITERIVIGKDGNTYKVPSNLQYKDWKDCYVNHTISHEELLQRTKKKYIIKK